MANQAFTQIELKSSIESYLAGESAYLIANRLRVNTAQFLKWVDEFSSSGEIDTQKIAQKGFPVMAEKLHAVLNPPVAIEVKEEEPKVELIDKPKRTRTVLSPESKRELYEFVKAGATKAEAAEFFSVSTATVSNIMSAGREEDEGPETKTSPHAWNQTVQAQEVIRQMYSAKDVGVTIEGDFIVVRFPKKTITRELLKDVL